MEKTNLSTTRLYVGCDDTDSIPGEITVIIDSKLYKATIKIETKILEPSEIRPSKESWERAKTYLHDPMEFTQVTTGK